MILCENFETTYVISNVFMSVPSLEPVEPILWKIITKHSEMNKKNKIPVALYAQLPGIHLPPPSPFHSADAPGNSHLPRQSNSNYRGWLLQPDFDLTLLLHLSVVQSCSPSGAFPSLFP